MVQESELSRLEQFVEKLLARFNDLRDENSKLQQELAARDERISELQGSVASQQSERGEISQRLGKIVAQIEAWERTLDPEDEEEQPSADVSLEVTETTEVPDVETPDVETPDVETPDVETPDVEAEADTAAVDAPEAEEEVELVEEVLSEEQEKMIEDEGRVQHNLFSMPQNRR